MSDVLSAVGVHRIRDQAVDRGRSTSVQPVGQYRVDDGSLEQRVQRTSGPDWVRSVRRAFLSAVGAGSKACCRRGSRVGCGSGRTRGVRRSSRLSRAGPHSQSRQEMAFEMSLRSLTRTNANGLTHFRALSLRTSTKDNVAREQTLVLSTLAIGHDRILRRGADGLFETRRRQELLADGAWASSAWRASIARRRSW